MVFDGFRSVYANFRRIFDLLQAIVGHTRYIYYAKCIRILEICIFRTTCVPRRCLFFHGNWGYGSGRAAMTAPEFMQITSNELLKNTIHEIISLIELQIAYFRSILGSILVYVRSILVDFRYLFS